MSTHPSTFVYITVQCISVQLFTILWKVLQRSTAVQLQSFLWYMPCAKAMHDCAHRSYTGKVPVGLCGRLHFLLLHCCQMSALHKCSITNWQAVKPATVQLWLPGAHTKLLWWSALACPAFLCTWSFTHLIIFSSSLSLCSIGSFTHLIIFSSSLSLCSIGSLLEQENQVYCCRESNRSSF